MHWRASLVLSLLLLTHPAGGATPKASHWGGWVGLSPTGWCFTWSEHVPCYIDLAVGVPRTLYIMAQPERVVTSGGLAGAEFRITAPPSGLLLTWQANPAIYFIDGEPFSNESLPEGSRGGVSIAFSTCETGEYGFVSLFTVTALLLEDLENVSFRTLGRDPPTNANFDCPVIYACDAPLYTAFCASGGNVSLNNWTRVEGRSWGTIKALFR